MKKLILTLCIGAASICCATAQSLTGDSISAAQAFVRLPAETLDLLTTSMRKDLVDYAQNGSFQKISNAMEGLTYVVAPMTPDYLKVQVTPVSTLTLRVLQTGGKPIVMSIYTVGDSVQAPDSDIRFYDSYMHELKRDKYIKLADTNDFLKLKDVPKDKRRELEESIPFPTVEYSIGPYDTTLTARLTVGQYMGKEDLERVTPYLQRERRYQWTGSKYKEIK